MNAEEGANPILGFALFSIKLLIVDGLGTCKWEWKDMNARSYAGE